MGIFEFLENLQKKPEAHRKKILFIAVAAIMCVIIFVWLTTFNLGGAKKAVERIGSPSDFLKEDIIDFYGFVKNIFK